ncbi:MAG: cell division protein FtsH [Dehalococcoidales bacterium]|nr:cell division protein FtsH [Dehalococcoidales bacterium]
MFKTQQVTGPVAPGQYGAMQVSGPGAYYPTQTTDPTSGMFSAMMPMIMMVMMMAMIMPMMKGVTAKE